MKSNTFKQFSSDLIAGEHYYETICEVMKTICLNWLTPKKLMPPDFKFI